MNKNIKIILAAGLLASILVIGLYLIMQGNSLDVGGATAPPGSTAPPPVPGKGHTPASHPAGKGTPAPQMGILMKAEELVNSARIKKKPSNFDKAEKMLRTALKTEAAKDMVYTALGHMVLQKAHYDAKGPPKGTDPAYTSAKKYFDKALGINPKNVRALEGLSLCHLARREISTALKITENILKILPDHTPSLLSKANCLMELKEWDKAEKAALVALEKTKKVKDKDGTKFANELIKQIKKRSFAPPAKAPASPTGANPPPESAGTKQPPAPAGTEQPTAPAGTKRP